MLATQLFCFLNDAFYFSTKHCLSTKVDVANARLRNCFGERYVWIGNCLRDYDPGICPGGIPSVYSLFHLPTFHVPVVDNKREKCQNYCSVLY